MRTAARTASRELKGILLIGMVSKKCNPCANFARVSAFRLSHFLLFSPHPRRRLAGVTLESSNFPSRYRPERAALHADSVHIHCALLPFFLITMSNESRTPYGTDLLNREHFAGKFERFILTEHHFVDGALVITLAAPFGAGKTTFVQMWTADLRARRGADAALPRVVVLNAWETDFCGDPFLAILAALRDAVTEGPDPKPETANKLKEAAKDIGWFTLSLAGGFVSKSTGLDAVKAGDTAAKMKDKRLRPEPLLSRDLLDAYQERRDALAKIKAALREAFHGEDIRAIVVIDELDRCRPDYAISYLETIKHVFDVHGICFVLCIDERQLASAASVLFGAQLTFAEYYRKFSHRTILLPQPSKTEVAKLTSAYVRQFLAHEGKRWCAMELREGPVSGIPELFGGLRMQPRQAQEAFRIIGHAFAKRQDDEQRANWVWAGLIIFMAALKVGRPDFYERLRRGDARPSDAAAIVSEVLTNARNPRWWFELVVSSLRRDQQWEGETANEMKKLKFWEQSGNGDVRRALSQFLAHTGDFNDGVPLIQQVAMRIEGIAGFTDQ